MKLLVAIPSYKNVDSGYSIAKTLEGLCQQSFKDFSLLIVYKPHPLDKTLDIIDKYKDKLNIEIIKQNVGYFEEALNIIFETSKDYDLTLNLDDDVIPSNNCLNEHILLHNCFERVALIGGKIEPMISHYRQNRLFRRILSLVGYDKPLYDIFRQYLGYINDVGLEYVKEPSQFRDHIMFSLDLSGVGGANMSFKGKAVENFELPCATLRGLGYEALLAVHAIKQGYHVAATNNCKVMHLERESLSRGQDQNSRLAIVLEGYIQPYLINNYEKININKLKHYSSIIKYYTKFRRTTYSKTVSMGLSLSIKAIEEQWKPAKVRDTIVQLTGDIKGSQTVR